jgi:hypothetical protein
MWTAVLHLIHKPDLKRQAEEFEKSLESAKTLRKKSKSFGKRTQSLGFMNMNRIHPDTTRSPAELVPADLAPAEEDYPKKGLIVPSNKRSALPASSKCPTALQQKSNRCLPFCNKATITKKKGKLWRVPPNMCDTALSICTCVYSIW